MYTSLIFLIPDIYFVIVLFFFFNDTATTEIYTLSLHDALPISPRLGPGCGLIRIAEGVAGWPRLFFAIRWIGQDRKSTRLNSSHSQISYAVFCLKKKKKKSSTQLIQTPQGQQRPASPSYASPRR